MTDNNAEIVSEQKRNKLIWGIVLDLVGLASYGIPFVAEITDVIWAPIAGFILNRMYKGTVGVVGGITVFIEELMPGLDFIPTFTLTWIYTYLIKKDQ